jgi:hypothetical protein
MKSSTFITVLSLGLVISLSSFTNGGGNPLAANPTPKAPVANAQLEIDVNAYMATLGLTTTVDDKELEAEYPSVSVEFLNGNNVEIKFANPTAQQYRLDIYDAEGNIVVTYVDIFGDTVNIENRFVGSTGNYLYKLSGEGNTYAGKFSAQLQ